MIEHLDVVFEDEGLLLKDERDFTESYVLELGLTAQKGDKGSR